MIRVFHKNLIGMEDTAYHSMYDMLSSYSKNKVDSTQNQKHKNQRLAACYMLENAIMEIKGRDEEIRYDTPYIICGLNYSVSHSGNLVCVAVGDKPVGIDTEEIKRTTEQKVSRIAKSRFFTECERKKMSEGVSVEDFLKIWTFKEAMTKASGISLMEMLSKADYFKMLNEAIIDDENNFKWKFNKNNYVIKQYKRDGGVYTLAVEL